MNVLIIDDDWLVSTSLKTILEADSAITVVDISNSGQEAILLFRQWIPDILLMDIRMEGMNGIVAAEKIMTEFPDAKILFLTTFSDDEYIIQAFHIGAKGYILKQDFESIVPALKAVFSGQSVFGKDIVSKIPGLLNTTKTFDYNAYGISAKEYEIIELISTGLNNKEVSETLFLSEGTIRNYLSNILDKLDLRDRTQLAIFYYKHK